MTYTEQLNAAVEAVDKAQARIRDYFDGSFDISIKADNSPVTEADVAAEQIIKSALLSAFSGYGFYGEETDRVAPSGGDSSDANADADYLWLVDPIDGTKSFIRRSPFFSTQVALMAPQGLILGISNAPCFPVAGPGQSQLHTERVEAVRGQGCRRNGQVVTTRDVRRLEDAYLSSGNLKSLALDATRWGRYAQLVSRVARVRGYGDFYHYHQLVSGEADLVVESDVNILDIAALVVAVEEAGGVFTDIHGDPVGLETTSVLAAATPQLHRETLELLAGKS